MNALTLLVLWILAQAGAVDPCAVPALAQSEAYAATCEAPPSPVDKLRCDSTDISNGF